MMMTIPTEYKKFGVNSFAILSDNDLTFEEGKKDEMLGKIQIQIGKSKKELHKIIESFSKSSLPILIQRNYLGMTSTLPTTKTMNFLPAVPRMTNNHQYSNTEIQTTMQHIPYYSSVVSAPKEKTRKIRVSGTRRLVCIMQYKDTESSLDKIPFQKHH